MCEANRMWLSAQSRHANVAVEMYCQGIHATALCLAVGRPSGSPRANVPACRGDLPGRFQDRPLTNHVSSFVVAGPKRSNPRPSRATAVLLRTVYIGHCNCEFSTVRLFRLAQKEVLRLRSGKGRMAASG